MSATVEPTQSPPQKSGFQTQVSGYDRFSAMLSALVLMIGFFAVLLFLVWLTKIIIPRPLVPNIIALEDLKGRGAAAEGVARDLEEPGVEELADVQEPQLADALEAMTDAISSTRGVTESFAGNAVEMGTGSGQGDSREAGPGGDGNLDVIPAAERLEVKYETNSVNDYAKKLDGFGIELGALNKKTPNIDYAFNLAGAIKRRSGTRNEEPRLFFVHPSAGGLAGMSKQLLEKAGVITTDRYLAQFYPDAAFAQLLAVEKAALGGRSLAKVKKTVFGIRSAGTGFEFYVIRQDYLAGA